MKNILIILLLIAVAIMYFNIRDKEENMVRLVSINEDITKVIKETKETNAKHGGKDFEHGLSYAINKCIQVADTYEGYDVIQIREVCDKIR